jgi:Tfp pilus assembly protein PilW
MTPSDNPLRDEAGFTLVEMMAVMVLGMIVAFAVFTTFENFASSASRQSRVTDANDQVRKIMDRVVADLRQAATVEVAAPNDLVYTLPDSTSELRRERICLDGSGKLWRASLKFAPPPAAPTAAATAVAAAGSCPTPSSNAAPVSHLRSRNSVSNPIFRYDSATAASVRTIGMTFALDAGSAQTNDTSTLKASAFRRAKGETAPAADDDDIGLTCEDAGPLLTLDASIGSASVTYATVDGENLGTASAGTALQLPGTATTVVATITNTVTGGVTQLVKELAC